MNAEDAEGKGKERGRRQRQILTQSTRAPEKGREGEEEGGRRGNAGVVQDKPTPLAFAFSFFSPLWSSGALREPCLSCLCLRFLWDTHRPVTF